MSKVFGVYSDSGIFVAYGSKKYTIEHCNYNKIDISRITEAPKEFYLNKQDLYSEDRLMHG